MTDYNETALNAVLLVLAISVVVTLVLVLVGYVVMAIALMTFFRKVGVEPWIAWVPFYSTWKWLEIGGQQGAFVLFCLIPYGSIVTSVFLYIGMYRTGIAFGRDAGFLVLGIFLPFVWAFMLGAEESVYHPERITAAGYPPPLAGYGSAR
ncbi:high-affinity Fe2+/Pb2+ permease [Leifsonia sp. AK011]|uniref:DUF5684 domain-containing protein n=1 Tax=Leifsonia sp. AK011 TaxID=2723075 RepID=UPI0015C83B59|nr:DUF5684 domain-containing protein [Leifsonia sp. AK011]NYF10355.1 high-affinity Fe2+/Pb2+ permease [Leifsonia sp. AK011]